MGFSSNRAILALLQLGSVVVEAARSGGHIPASTAGTDALAAVAVERLGHYYASQQANNPCTLGNVAVRREWGALSSSEKIGYIDAVKCLMGKPSRLDPVEVPGAKNRYDDFVAVHINQTLTIHGTANFLSWHRYFTWVYEQALRNECGYTGYQPYWNWGKWAFDPIHSPLFDGSETSMSGNGVFEEHNCSMALPTGLNCIPPGEGGGCVATGPFANVSVNMGPISPVLTIPELVAVKNLFDYNPRCLRRDISVWVSSRWTTDQNSTDLISQKADIETFQYLMQGNFTNGDYGVHAGGHYTIGGDPGGDFFTSPADPAFYLHHSQIDRTWWIWQNQDPEARTTGSNSIGGSITFANNPPSRNGTLDDLIDLGVLAETLPIRSIMSTVGLTGGPLCYTYV